MSEESQLRSQNCLNRANIFSYEPTILPYSACGCKLSKILKLKPGMNWQIFHDKFYVTNIFCQCDYALVRSVLEYCCVVWANSISEYLRKKTELVQKRVMQNVLPDFIILMCQWRRIVLDSTVDAWKFILRF